VPLHELAHVQPDHGALVVEHHLGQGLAEFGLSHPRGAEEEERPDRPVRVLEPGAAAAHGIGHGRHRLVLVHQALVDPLLEHEELGPLGLHHAGHGNAGPRADDFGDLLRADLLTQQTPAAVVGARRLGVFDLLGQPVLLLVQLVKALELGLARRDARGLLLLDGGAQAIVFELDVVEPAADVLDVPQAAFLLLPLLAEPGELRAQLGHLLLDLLALLVRVLLGLFGQLPVRQLELHQAPLHGVDLARHAL